MAQQNCSSCHGVGSYLGSESVRDYSGGFMWKQVQVRKTCLMCGGSGRVWAPDTPSVGGTRPVRNRSAVPASRASRPTTAEKDEAFANLVMVVITGGCLYALFARPVEADPWIKLAVAVGAGGVSRWLLHRLPTVTRALRYAAVLALVLGMILLLVAIWGG